MRVAAHVRLVAHAAAVRGHPVLAVAELVVLMSGVEAAGAHFPIPTGWRDATTTPRGVL